MQPLIEHRLTIAKTLSSKFTYNRMTFVFYLYPPKQTNSVQTEFQQAKRPPKAFSNSNLTKHAKRGPLGAAAVEVAYGTSGEDARNAAHATDVSGAMRPAGTDRS
jgi:hypothetical protein